MHSTDKTPSPAGKAAAVAVAATVAACAACCLPLLTPLALSLLAGLSVYSVSDALANGWWLAGALLLVASPLLVWRWRITRRRTTLHAACATDCSCKPVAKV